MQDHDRAEAKIFQLLSDRSSDAPRNQPAKRRSELSASSAFDPRGAWFYGRGRLLCLGYRRSHGSLVVAVGAELSLKGRALPWPLVMPHLQVCSALLQLHEGAPSYPFFTHCCRALWWKWWGCRWCWWCCFGGPQRAARSNAFTTRAWSPNLRYAPTTQRIEDFEGRFRTSIGLCLHVATCP